MRIYTRTGDGGETGLIGGGRVPKTDVRIQAIGDVDELNAAIGIVRVASGEFQTKLLERLQSALFDLGSELAAPPESDFKPTGPHPELTLDLEKSIDIQSAALPKLKNFILPGGSDLASRLHLARGVCRRAERSILSLHEISPISVESRTFINRLSDWLFISARSANAAAGREDILWKGTEK